MSNSSGAMSAFATAKFAKFQTQQKQGGKAISEYDAAKKAEYAKTARLRALRLAKEEEDRRVAAELAASGAGETKSPARRRPAKPKSGAATG